MLTPGSQLVTKLEDGADCARVTPALVNIPEKIRAWAKDRVPERVELFNQGPYASIPVKFDNWRDPRSFSLYGLTGSVEQHTDDLGKTVGMVVSLNGSQELLIEDKVWPLEPGCIYHLDSDKNHGTIAGTGEDGMTFVCVDIGEDEFPEGYTYHDVAQFMISTINKMITGSSEEGMASACLEINEDELPPCYTEKDVEQLILEKTNQIVTERNV